MLASNYMFPSKQGYDAMSSHFLYVHNLEGEFLYLSPEFDSVVGESSSLFLRKSYDELLANDETNLIQVRSNTSKTIELFKQDPNSFNSYEVLMRNFKGEGFIVCRLFERVLYDQSSDKILGIQGVTVIPNSNMDLLTSYYTFLLQKACLSFVCQPFQSSYQELPERVCEIFETHLQFLNQTNDHWETKGKNLFLSQVQFFIGRGLPIEFVLPAFPFKSGNSEKKVMGHLPDKGEKLALETLNTFIEEIQKIYPPGAKINIVSDGRVFADIFNISDEHVTEFGSELRNIAKDMGYTAFRFFDLQYFLDKCQTHDIARDRLVSYFGRTVEGIVSRISEDEDYQKMYCGFVKFMLEDLYSYMENEKNALRKKYQMSISQIKRDAGQRAKFVMMRNDAYSRMVATLFPLHIRLSIHAHNNSGPKFAIRLLPINKVSEKLVADKHLHIPTPWHNVVLEDSEGKFLLMKKFQVERLHHQKTVLIFDKNGRPSHYSLIQNNQC